MLVLDQFDFGRMRILGDGTQLVVDGRAPMHRMSGAEGLDHQADVVVGAAVSRYVRTRDVDALALNGPADEKQRARTLVVANG